MDYITGNYKFEKYLGQYVDVDVNGIAKKFYVAPFSNTTHVVASSYLMQNQYAITGLSENQFCSVPPSTTTTIPPVTTTIPPVTTTLAPTTTLSPCEMLAGHFYAHTVYMSSCNGQYLQHMHLIL